MKDVLETIERWRANGEPFALATVIKVDGSAPRDEGATMLVSASGAIAGSVSGGCVEGAVADEARGVLASGTPKIVRYGINKNMMWDVGLSCGGAIEVYIRPFEGQALPAEITRPIVLCMVVRGPSHVGAVRVVEANAGGNGSAPRDGSQASTGDAALDAAIDAAAAAAFARGTATAVTVGAHDVFLLPLLPDPRLIIVGAVHIAVALCDLAARSGFAVTVVDPRERLNNRARFPAARRLAVGWPEDELPALAPDENTYVAVLTHDEKFDDPTLAYVLTRAVRYVGAIGSRKTQAMRRKRLEQTGFSAGVIDTVHAPVGLDIGAQTPEEIAVAILAEMIAAKYERAGMKLKDQTGEHIHAS
ncbi:MAG: XdhC family protein [Candidatus Eremiobacteraeota bacterium]|nr:XdhC family protein [Candidatus Eremiobacteraeota bacterium]MBV8366543.1 XdhC family protein [Candidatus Eremiobacteraeota bacterium]